MPLYTNAEGDSESASFRSKDLVLIIIHSDAVAVIKVRDKKEGAAFYGQVTPLPPPPEPTPPLVGTRCCLLLLVFSHAFHSMRTILHCSTNSAAGLR